MTLISAALRPVLFLLLCAALFAGCCGAKSCECANNQVDALLFQFSADSLGPNPTGFRAGQLDTILIVRSAYPRRDSVAVGNIPAGSKSDTARVVRPRSTVFRTPIVIDNTGPFAVVTGYKVGSQYPDSSFRYTIIVPDTLRRRPAVKRYYIGRVEIQGQVEGDGCCSCYRNKHKRFTLRDLSRPASTTEWIDATSPVGAPRVVTELKR
ncbi:hypothetical protein EJV47_22095 [Hymenobacter gummosus]|uniref:Uncharacterized protein n=1 Tax=Hymenobacter gummosus TaxID=1776032 RepID=A0A3S0JB72_9BACT|nr:hypothetical protein [Hymenobacter gummosus]RTQ46225.1 hypothetical protein EJV47_22095 [Hymenobacter gummosus]